MRRLWIAGLAGALGLGLWSAAGAQDTGDVKALFEQKCSTCHPADRATSKKKDREGWEKTVLRMKNVNGCPITDEEAQAIIGYVTANHGR